MRERLVLAFIAVAVGSILAFAVPRGYGLASVVRAQDQQQLGRTASLVSVVLAGQVRDGMPVTPAELTQLLQPGERLTYNGPNGRTAAAGAPFPTSSALSAVRRVAGAGTVRLLWSGAKVQAQIEQALLPLVVTGIVLVVLSVLLALFLANGLARPFRLLAAVASDLGHGRFDVTVPKFGGAEADNIGTALKASAERLDGMVRREREFASNASHQLRTPLTALRLDLDDLSRWPETSQPVRAQLAVALHEVDRLGDTVDDLLALARAKPFDEVEELDLTALAAKTVERWARSAPGRTLDFPPHPEVVRVHASVGPVGQILDVLIDNALKHGTGRVRVTIRSFPDHVKLRVSDEGRQYAHRSSHESFARGVSHEGGEGIGLAVASELALALGGRLSLAPEASTTFELALPTAPDQTQPAEPAEATAFPDSVGYASMVPGSSS